MIKILIVDDEQENVNVIEKFSKLKGYHPTGVTSPLDALDLVKQQDFDLIILDVVMPNLNGFELLEKINTFKKVNVIFLSARGAVDDRISGLRLGAVDYMVKPFSMEELFLKIENITKSISNKLIYDGITLDTSANTIFVDGIETKLTGTLFRLLQVLISHKNNSLSREFLLSEVWNITTPGYNRTVDTHILKLRKLLGPMSYKIVTIKGEGYMYED